LTGTAACSRNPYFFTGACRAEVRFTKVSRAGSASPAATGIASHRVQLSLPGADALHRVQPSFPRAFAAHRVLTSPLAPMRLIGRCLSPPSEADSVSAGHRLDAGSAPGPESALCGRAQKRRTATRKPTGKVPVKAAYAPRPGGGRLTLR